MSTDEQDDLPAAWQWPGLWSTNLPVLILLWYLLFAHCFHIWPSHYQFFAVAGLAWTFVAAERWIFLFRLRPDVGASLLGGDLAEQRGKMVRICLLIVIGIVLIARFGATQREVAGMLIWSSIGGGYLVALRLAPRQTAELLPREMALAVYLAGTAALFIWANASFPPMRLFLPALLFLLLLFFYFCLVGSRSPSLLPTPSTGPLLDGAGGSFFRGVPLFLVLSTLLFVFFNRDTGTNPLFLSLTVSAATLLLLDLWKEALPPAAFRVLADVALLSPVLPLAIGY